MFVVVETLVGCFRVRNRYEGEIRIFYFQFSFPIFAIVDSLTSLKKMLNGSVYSERSLSGDWLGVARYTVRRNIDKTRGHSRGALARETGEVARDTSRPPP